VYPIAKEGGKCGGSVGPEYSTRCGILFSCLTSDIGDLGSFGACVRNPPIDLNAVFAQPGDPCSGGMQHSKRCAPNAYCHRKLVPGATGKCVEDRANLGEACGGSIRYAIRCADDLSCVVPTNLRGAGGYCVPVASE